MKNSKLVSKFNFAKGVFFVILLILSEISAIAQNFAPCDCPSQNSANNAQLSSLFPSQNIVSNTCLRVSGTLTIDRSIEFQNVNFDMLPGSTVELNIGTNLVLNNCRMYNCGEDNSWLGIKMYSTNTQLTLKNNTEINGAKVGIDLSKFPTGILWTPSQISINSNSKIANCITGVSLTSIFVLKMTDASIIGGASGNATAYGIKVRQVSNIDVGHIIITRSTIDLVSPFVNVGVDIAGTKVLGDAPLGTVNIDILDQSKIKNADYGISFKNIKGRKNILNSFIRNGTSGGIFLDNCRDGITITDSEIEGSYLSHLCNFNALIGPCIIENNHFTNVVITSNENSSFTGILVKTADAGGGTRIINNEIRQCQTGIDYQNTAVAPIFNGKIIKENLIEGSKTALGIKASNSVSAQILQNDIAIAKGIGIQIEGGNNLQLFRNSIKAGTDNNIIAESRGVRVRGATNTAYNCNLISNCEKSFVAFGTCTGSSINRNKFRNAAIGLELSQSTQVGVQRYKFNSFVGPFTSGLGATHLGSVALVNSSQFIVRSAVGSVEHPYHSPLGFFEQVAIPGNPPIDEECPPLTNSEEALSIEQVERIIAYPITAEPAHEAMNFDAHLEIYKYISNHQYLLAESPAINAFFLGMANTNTQKFASIDLAMENTNINIPYSEQATIQLYEAAALAESNYLNLLASGTQLEIETAYNAFVSAYQIYLGAINQNRNYLQTLAASLLAANTAISAATPHQENRKFINEILLTKVLPNDLELTNLQQLTILDIAQLCYLEGGSSVLKAKGLYELLTNSALSQTESETCINEIAPRATFSAAKSLIEVFPNPASEAVQLTINEQGPYQLVIVDLHGTIVKSLDNNNPLNVVHNIDLSEMPGGIYWIRLSTPFAQETKTLVHVK